MLDMLEGKAVAAFRPPSREEGPDIFFSSAGDFVVHVTWSGLIRIHRTENLVVEHVIEQQQDMLFAFSASSDRSLWVMGHRRGISKVAIEPPRELLSLWKWPLKEPFSVHNVGPAGLDDVSLSPCGCYIAAVRAQHDGVQREIVVMTLEGEALATTPIQYGGTGSRLRWSSDSRRIAAVVARAFAIYRAPSLELVATISHAYPSDMAFFDSNSSIVLGTWEYGVLATLDSDK